MRRRSAWHAADPTRWDSFGSFTTGAYDSYVLVETAAGAGGIQFDFTLLGARGFIGAPLDSLANRAVSLDEIFGTKGRELTAALYEARGWQRRFDLLDRVVAARHYWARDPEGFLWGFSTYQLIRS